MSLFYFTPKLIFLFHTKFFIGVVCQSNERKHLEIDNNKTRQPQMDGNQVIHGPIRLTSAEEP